MNQQERQIINLGRECDQLKREIIAVKNENYYLRQQITNFEENCRELKEKILRLKAVIVDKWLEIDELNRKIKIEFTQEEIKKAMEHDP